MNKSLLIYSLLSSCFCLSVNAQGNYCTPGNGATYSFSVLSQTEGSGVRLMEGKPNSYIVEKTDTIAAGDRFELDDDATVYFADKTSLVIKGEANLKVDNDKPTTLTRLNENATPYNIRIDNQEGAEVQSVVFEFLGLESLSKGSITVDNCLFVKHNGSSAAALFFISSGTLGTITNSRFESCEKAAIGSAANACQPLNISNCFFERNSTRNENIPQINITASNIEIDSCMVIGDSTSLTVNNMVGGIGISNFYSFADTKATIRNSTIKHNRYGIGTVGPIDVRIQNNTILNNNHEANPMNGGSGISLYDPYKQTKAVIAGNQISGNHWGITIIGCKDVNVGQPSNSMADSPGGNILADNGFDGQFYDLYNNSTLTVYAQNNTWGVDEQTAEKIETVIFHQADNPSLGLVIYQSDEELGIKSTNTGTETTAPTFTLQGTKSGSTSRRGIYIRNGKKIIR